MNREQKIEALYNKIADKTLSLLCKIKIKNRLTWRICITEFLDWLDWFILSFDKTHLKYKWEMCMWWDEEIEDMLEIIWHTIYIGDVLDYIENDDYFETITDIQQELIELWGHKRKPLEDQSDECIDYLFNLIIWN